MRTWAGLALVAMMAAACDDETANMSSGAGGSSSSTGGVTSTSTGTGGAATTATSVTEAHCASFATDTPTPLDGNADPPALVTPDGTLYEMSLHLVPEPTQYVGFAEVEIVEAGSYLLLVMEEPPGDNTVGAGFIREITGGIEPDGYVQCDACFDACGEVENAWVYDLQPATYQVGIMLQELASVRLLVQPVDG